MATGAIGEATKDRLMELAGVITQPVGNDLSFGCRLFVETPQAELPGGR